MRVDELDFELPPELIAQVPAERRSESRLLHYRRSDRSISHRIFSDLPSILRSGDLLVFNDSKVLPAKMLLKKDTGGWVEGLLLSELEPGRWRVMLRDLGKARHLRFAEAEKLGMDIEQSLGSGEYEVKVNSHEPASVVLERVGRMPLPPYIHRARGHDERDELDRQRYQTVYAKASGSVAAPTAGLHFSPEVLSELERKGIERCFVTLHVGVGTFKPVTSDTLEGHRMHSEAYTISAPAAEQLNRAKAEGRRIVAVGTTAARVLESQQEDQPFQPKTASTDIFIYPPYRFKHVGALVTNFHLPRSTLIALLAAMVGLDEQRKIYADAIARSYRFFSYGDAMFVD